MTKCVMQFRNDTTSKITPGLKRFNYKKSQQDDADFLFKVTVTITTLKHYSIKW